MKTILFGLLLSAVVAILCPRSLSAQDTISEDDVVRSVVASDYQLEAARRASDAARARSAQIIWPFPMVDVGLMPSMISDGEAGVVIMARQPIPWPGRLGRQRAALDHEAEAALASVDVQERSRILDARLAYARLWGLQREIAIVDSFTRRLDVFEEGAISAYAAGRGSQVGAIQVQIERERLLQRRERLEDDAIELVQTINRLAGGRIQIDIETMLEPPPAVEGAEITDSSLLLAIDAHPAVRESRLMEAAQEVSIDVARFDGRPEITLGADINLSPMARERMYGLEPVMPVVGFTVPLWRSGVRAQVEEATARLYEREAQTAGIRLELETEVSTILGQIAATRSRIDRLESRLRPRIDLALESVLTAVRAGTASTIDLLDLERSAVEIQTDILSERIRLAELSARLHAITGERQ